MGPRPLARHLHNLRDVADATRSSTRPLRPGILYRSAAPLRESPTIVEDLRRLGVTDVLDLRDDAERAMSPRVLTSSDFRIHEVPVFENQLGSTRFESLEDLYRITLHRHAGALARAFRTLAHAPDHAVTLVHCTAGKDRTGMTVALALEAIGVDRDAVLTDFQRSEEMLDENYLVDLFRGTPLEQLPGGAAHRAISSPRRLLESGLRQVDDMHGGARAFLLAGGVNPSELDRFARRMLDSRTPAVALAPTEPPEE